MCINQRAGDQAKPYHTDDPGSGRCALRVFNRGNVRSEHESSSVQKTKKIHARLHNGSLACTSTLHPSVASRVPLPLGLVMTRPFATSTDAAMEDGVLAATKPRPVCAAFDLDRWHHVSETGHTSPAVCAPHDARSIWAHTSRLGETGTRGRRYRETTGRRRAPSP